MPRIPQYQPQVSPTNDPAARLANPFTPGAMGAAVGESLQKAGNAVLQVYEREKEKADIAALMEADRALSDLEMELFHDPEKGAYGKRGRDAFGLPDQVFPTWDGRVAQIEGRLTPEQRAAFRRQAEGRRADLQRSLSRHVMQESERFYADESKAYVSAAAGAAAANYTDPERIAVEESRAIRGALSFQDGASPEVQRQRVLEATTAVHGAVLDRMLSESPDAAMKYLLANEDKLDPAVSSKYRATLAPLARAYEATRIVDGIVGGTGQAPAVDLVWGRMIHRESRGQQFGPDGEPLTSSAGATGAAQVMPGTGPEAARLAGLPWDEARFANDKEYNLALGRAYFEAQVAKYGDPRLAAAAYNGGPGNVNKWLKQYGDPRKGEVSWDAWVAAIPFKETREYVEAVAPSDAPAGRTQGGEISLSDALRQARTIPDPQLRREVEADIKGRYEIERLEREEGEAQLLEAVNDKVENAPPGAKLAEVLTPDEYASLTRMGRVPAFEARLVQRLEGTDAVTDPAVLSQLQVMFTRAENGDAAALSEVRKLDPTTLYSKLDRQTRDYVQNRRAAILNPVGGQGGADGKDKTPDFASEDKLLQVEAWLPLGVPSTGGTPEQEAIRAQFLKQYWTRLAEVQTATGKKATSEQRQKIMRDLLLPFSREVKRDWLPDTVESVPAFQVEVPDLDREQIIAAYRKRYGVDPTENQIVSRYAAANNMRLQQGSE